MAKNLLIRKMISLSGRIIQIPRIIFYKLLSNNNSNVSAICTQPLQLMGLGTIKFAGNVRFGVFPSPKFHSTYSYLEARNPTTSISIGANTWINNNFSAIAEHSKIEIGQNCLIGANVQITDSDFHGLSLVDRRVSKPEWAAPVIIGDNVFIGSNVKIMKGVTIGNGAVVGNGSLVLRDVSPQTIVGGVPAKVIRTLEINE